MNGGEGLGGIFEFNNVIYVNLKIPNLIFSTSNNKKLLNESI